MLIARTPVRISFGGGGTDLPSYFEKYGGAVLSATINKYVYTIIHERKDGHLQIISSDLQVFQNCKHLNEIDLNGSPLALPLAVLKALGHPVSVDVFVASEVPPGTGLGSSAAVCVNTLYTMAAYLGETRTKYDLAQKAFSIVSRSFAKPIGKQDEFAVAFGNLNFLTFHSVGATSLEPLQLPPEAIRKLEQKLMLFFTGQARNSWTILEQQDQSVRLSNSLVVHSLHEIRRLAQEMREKLLNGALREFGLLLHQGWESKNGFQAQCPIGKLIDCTTLRGRMERWVEKSPAPAAVVSCCSIATRSTNRMSGRLSPEKILRKCISVSIATARVFWSMIPPSESCRDDCCPR